MKQQSAVEFILDKILDGDWESTPWPKRREIIEQAKQMEKEHIKNAFRFGLQDECVISAEQYYNETYNK